MSKKPLSASERAADAAPESQIVLLKTDFQGYVAGSVLRMKPDDARAMFATPDVAIPATQEQAERAAPSYFFDLVPPVAIVEEAGASEVFAASDAAPPPAE
jgi:hypothetical protein